MAKWAGIVGLELFEVFDNATTTNYEQIIQEFLYDVSEARGIWYDIVMRRELVKNME